MTKYELISIGISILSLFSVWITLAINKYQTLKKDYKAHAIGFAKMFNLIEDDNIKRAIVNDAKTQKLLIDGQTVDDEVYNFSATPSQFLKCLKNPF